jgi:hypothetical protein
VADDSKDCILVGLPADSENFMSFLGNAMAKTAELVDTFIQYSELLIIHYVQRWGFVREDA